MLSLTGGNWVSATGVFTKTASIANVSVGMFAAVRVDGATLAARVGRVTAVDANTVTISTTAGSGSLADQTGTASIVVGGPWKGPNAAVGFPFGFITNALTNAAGDYPRVNFKNNATYSITAAITHALAGPIQFQGYTSTAGDGGKAIIDGGTAGVSYTLFTQTSNGSLVSLYDLIFQNNGASGSASGVSVAGHLVVRCVVHDVRGHGWLPNATTMVECEAYNCNQSASGSIGAFRPLGGANLLVRCVAHDNAGTTTGFLASQTIQFVGCIADSNGGAGFLLTTGPSVMHQCDAYNNGGDGCSLNTGNSQLVYISNCNFVKNGAYGVGAGGAASLIGQVVNCGFGSGTQANTSGAVNTGSLPGIVVTGSVTYAADATPWAGPANGDFRITLAAAKGAGRGAFTQTQASYTGAVSYPDIGAGQASSAGGGGKFWPRRLR